MTDQELKDLEEKYRYEIHTTDVDVLETGAGVIMNSWYFGPQGHTCSLNIHIVMFEEPELVKLELWILGPASANFFIRDVKSFTILKRFIEYGLKINDAFGTDSFWHECSPDCEALPKPADCCSRHEEKSREAGAKWFVENPMPSIEIF